VFENFWGSSPDVGYNRPMLQTARPKEKQEQTGPPHERYFEAFDGCSWRVLSKKNSRACTVAEELPEVFTLAKGRKQSVWPAEFSAEGRRLRAADPGSSGTLGFRGAAG